MPELPRISGDEAIRVFMALGFYQARQKGSHVVMRRDDKGCVIPRHKQLIALYPHEKFNGKVYPQGLNGENISTR